MASYAKVYTRYSSGAELLDNMKALRDDPEHKHVLEKLTNNINSALSQAGIRPADEQVYRTAFIANSEQRRAKWAKTAAPAASSAAVAAAPRKRTLMDFLQMGSMRGADQFGR
jgi:hypothetical protein